MLTIKSWLLDFASVRNFGFGGQERLSLSVRVKKEEFK